MKLGIVTAYPPSKITLNEYAFHLVKHFRNHPDLSSIVVYADRSVAATSITVDAQGCEVAFIPCWKFNGLGNVFSIRAAVKESRPDVVMYNLQFMKFGDKKIPAALGLLSPWITRSMRIPTLVLLHNIMETVDLESAGFTSNKIKQQIFGFIGTVLTRVILKANMVTVTIDSYAKVLATKYKACLLYTSDAADE